MDIDKVTRTMTHTGYLVGTDSRTPGTFKMLVNLRETKMFWITEYETKFRKATGRAVGTDWPMHCLDLNSIKKVQVTNAPNFD